MTPAETACLALDERRHAPEPPGILLRRAAYCALEEDAADYARPFIERVASLATAIGLQARRLTEGIDPSEIGECVVCSTAAPTTLTDVAVNGRAFRDAFEDSSGLRPSIIVTAYECATWGYMLRYFSRRRCSGLVLIVIMDANFHGMSFWTDTISWGKSGFGFGSMLFELLPHSGEDILARHATSANAVFDFAKSLRGYADRHGDLRVYLPFFPEPTRGLLDRQFARRRAADHHALHGHCFGNDPWIGIIRSLLFEPALAGRAAIAASLSLNGYWCAARIGFSAATAVSWARAHRSDGGFSLLEASPPQ